MSASPGITAFLTEYLRPGMTVVDVGANIGLLTAVAAGLVGPSGRVIAIEPAPENVARLQALRAAHPHIAVHQAAVAEEEGVTSLHLDAESSTRHSLAADNRGRAGESISVPVTTLTPFLPADLVKVDAQGAEARIVRGAAAALSTWRPVLVLEFWPAGLRACGDDPAQLLARLAGLGYRVTRLSAKGQLKPAFDLGAYATDAGKWNSINVVALPA